MPRLNPETGKKVCSKCLRELTTDFYAKNARAADGFNVRCRDCMRGYYEENAEHAKWVSRSYYRNNRRAVKEKNDREEKKQQRKKYNKEYNKANPNVRRAAAERRKARMARADDGTINKEVLRQMLKACGGRCMKPGCGATEHLTVDHVVPLQKKSGRKGTHSVFNIQILCQHCNSEKGHRRSTDYRPADWPWRLENFSRKPL